MPVFGLIANLVYIPACSLEQIEEQFDKMGSFSFLMFCSRTWELCVVHYTCQELVWLISHVQNSSEAQGKKNIPMIAYSTFRNYKTRKCLHQYSTLFLYECNLETVAATSLNLSGHIGVIFNCILRASIDTTCLYRIFCIDAHKQIAIWLADDMQNVYSISLCISGIATGIFSKPWLPLKYYAFYLQFSSLLFLYIVHIIYNLHKLQNNFLYFDT